MSGGGNSTFKIVRPMVVTPANMTSNIEYYGPMFWISSANYGPSAVVYYGEFLYYSTSGGTNTGNQPDISPSDWELIPDTPSDFNPASVYSVYDAVLDNGIIYSATLTSPAIGVRPSLNPSQWIPLVSLTKMWKDASTYSIGDVVFGGDFPDNPGTVYESLTNGNIGNAPESSPSQWQLVQRNYARWSSFTTYPSGINGGVTRPIIYNKVLYRTLSPGNLNRQPDISPEYWQEVGPAPGWAPFDQKTGSQDTRPGELKYVFTPEGRYDTIGFISIAANNINITINDGTTDVYDEDFNLVSTDEIYDWYTYFLEQPTLQDRLFVGGLPAVMNPIITITLTGPQVSVGLIVVGRSRDVGETKSGATIGIQDFSVKQPDGFGGYFIRQRGFSDNGDFSVYVPSSWVDGLRRVLSEIRATPTLFIGTEDYTSTYYYGICTWSISFDYYNKAIAKIEITGL